MELTTLQLDIQRAVQDALKEDIGTGDITAELLPENQISQANIITREDCVVCGQPWFDEVFHQLDSTVSIQWHVTEGQFVPANTLLVSLSGQSRSLVTGERAALNFLQLLSGTATLSREMAKTVAGTDIKILDTRKTIPGLRTAQKYAVKIGGCENHRLALYDAFLIKENHITACGGVTAAIKKAKQLHPEKPIIVEVENYAEFCEAASHDITRIMLDNFSDEDLIKVSEHDTSIPVEVSGNITADNIQRFKNLKISAISSGSLTKHIRAIDLSMRLL